MTELNPKVKVLRKFKGEDCTKKTEVYLSEDVLKSLAKLRKKDRVAVDRYLQKLDRWAKDGFELHEGNDGHPVRHEGDKVYRVGFGTLFRLIGFYYKGKAMFLAIDHFEKGGQKLSDAERGRIKAVAKVRKDGNWKIADDDG